MLTGTAQTPISRMITSLSCVRFVVGEGDYDGTRRSPAQRQLFLPVVLPQPKTLLCDNRRYSFWGGARGGAAPPRPSARKAIHVERARYLRLSAHCQSRRLPQPPFL